MKFGLRILLLVVLVTGTLTQDGEKLLLTVVPVQ